MCIKSTLRETESLENNIKNKFIEFAKDFGLIVVGYSGSDRSIMDVLNFLLKYDDYYKHGIYWCLRKGDSIGEDLRKLLWKDRVYFVEIDGFDELFATFHNKICGEKLPIDTNFISNKSQEIIQSFIGNERLRNSESKTIQRDLSNLKEQSERNNFYDLIKEMQSDKDFRDEKFSNQEILSIMKVSQFINKSQYSDALNLINELSQTTTNKYLEVELLKRAFNANTEIGKKEEARKVNDKLIEIEPKNPRHLLRRFNLEESFEKKLEWINKAVELNEYDARFHHEKASLLVERYDFYLSGDNDKEEIIICFSKSIEVNPSEENPSWDEKFDFLKMYKDSYLNELNNIITCLSKQNPFSISVLQMKYALLESKQQKENFLNEVETAKNKYLGDNKISYDLLKLKILDELNDKSNIKHFLDALNLNDIYMKDIIFLRKKAHLLARKFDQLQEAIALLEKAIELQPDSQSIIALVEYLIYSGDLVEAKNVFNEHKYSLSNNEKLFIEKELFGAEGNYLEVFNKYENINELSFNKSRYISEMGFCLLKQKKYHEARELLFNFLHERHFNTALEAEIINYELACYLDKSGYTVDKKRLNNVLKQTSSSLVKAAVHVLLDNKTEAYKCIDEALEQNATSKYEFKDWVVFDPLTSEQKFKNYFEKNSKAR